MSENKVHITTFELENVKRVKAVAVNCEGQPLTVLGGNNGQGKTSVLDAIMWTLGGDKYKPTNAVRTGAEEAYTKVILSNGVIAERKGKNGTLKVTSPSGKGGQALLNEFINTFALDLPKFMVATGKEKADMLLGCFPGLGAQLQRLNAEYKKLYDERTAIGRIHERKAKYAAELPFDITAPEELLSGAEMTKQLQTALSHNAQNEAIRREAGKAESNLTNLKFRQQSAASRVADLERALKDAKAAHDDITRQVDSAQQALEMAKATTLSLQDQDTSAIQQKMEEIDAINARVRANESRRNAKEEARVLKDQYQEMSEKIEKIRSDRLKLLSEVVMPLPELSISEEGELIYRGQQWDCMADSERLQVATAICAAIQPKCGFVLLDMLEKLDRITLREFAAWLAARGLQAIGTRVSTGDECSIIIEDGMVAPPELEM